MNIIWLFFIGLICFNICAKAESEENKNASKSFSLSDFASQFKLDCNGLVRIAGKLSDIFTTLGNEVRFYLVTKNKTDKVRINTAKPYKDVDVNKRTVFIVHGFQNDGDSTWMKNLADAYTEWGDVNAIIVDWGDYAKTYDYTSAARSTKTAGEEIATFISQIINGKSKQPSSEILYGPLHLIGHSLGSHVIAVAAYEIKKRQLQWQVDRLTGLDPAQPCFEDAHNDLRLDKNDAPFVDVIHTNGKTLLEGGLGVRKQIGHIDFYPNGGEEQPGCEELIGINRTTCSHGMSYLFFTDSLKYSRDPTCLLKAFSWNQDWNNLPSKLDSEKICYKDKCIEMGINAENYKDQFNGSFFSVTGKISPFCRIGADAKMELRSLIKTLRNPNKGPKLLRKSKHLRKEKLSRHNQRKVLNSKKAKSKSHA